MQCHFFEGYSLGGAVLNLSCFAVWKPLAHLRQPSDDATSDHGWSEMRAPRAAAKTEFSRLLPSGTDRALPGEAQRREHLSARARAHKSSHGDGVPVCAVRNVRDALGTIGVRSKYSRRSALRSGTCTLIGAPPFAPWRAWKSSISERALFLADCADDCDH